MEKPSTYLNRCTCEVRIDRNNGIASRPQELCTPKKDTSDQAAFVFMQKM